jgi:hypothetical protein
MTSQVRSSATLASDMNDTCQVDVSTDASRATHSNDHRQTDTNRNAWPTREHRSLSTNSADVRRALDCPSSGQHIDVMTLLDDFERHTSTDSRRTSLSSCDLLVSLDRTANKHSSFDHDPSDGLLFLEWDRERALFQDYIGSLRKEIRVLLQERSHASDPSARADNEQSHIELVQASLNEKNIVIEQLQYERDAITGKNNELTRQLFLLNAETTFHVNTIDELKQKLADLTIDLDNHVMIRQRLQTSIDKFDHDCQTIDNERSRLAQDVKDSQQQRHELERSLQTAHVHIAEQGNVRQRAHANMSRQVFLVGMTCA